jgi:phthalate 4,5-dioxygenase oxygenase subunit
MRVRRVMLDAVKRVAENKPPVGVGIDLSRVVALDADLADGATWQDLVPSNRQSVPA